AKGFVGEVIPFQATAFREGHDAIGVELLLTDPAGATQRHPMHLITVGLDDYRVLAQVTAPGTWTFRVRAYSDDFETWHHNASIKIPAGLDVELMFTIGAQLLERAASETSRSADERAYLSAKSAELAATDSPLDTRTAVLDD